MCKNFSVISTPDKFYDEVSCIYENMIDFEKNLDLRINAYKKIFPATGKVVDIGCGIGMDSIALAMNGHDVTSFDTSPNMIKEAKRNAERFNVQINANVNSFGTITRNFNKKFDYAVSVGNTIAHLKPSEFKSAIKRIYKLLRNGGKVFLHILNYERIIKESRRINNIANRGGKVIIRFYDFGKKDIDFNILSFPIDNPKEHKLVTTKHYPHSKKEILKYLEEAGFKKIKLMENFTGGKFNVKDSKDLFVEAVKRL